MMTAGGWMKTVAFAALSFALLPSVALRAQIPGMTPAKHYAWSDKTLSPDQRADMVIKEMTLDEKIQMLHGPGWGAIFAKPESGPLTRAIAVLGFIPGVPRLGIPDLQMTDSNQGISLAGTNGRYATALPSGEAMAAAWDPKLSWEIGTMLGQEMRAMGFNMSLGSGINMIREPRNGRVFEYKGEDPLLAGTLAGTELKAEKALHLITDLKHYAVNDQDAGRIVVNSIIDKRSMRESDLLAFEIALKISDAGAFMCSYNKINGTYGCENEYTLNDVLKKDFGFKGFVVSDWGATQSTVKAAMAGLDIEMPGNDSFGVALKKAVEGGEVPMDRLNDMVHRILRTEFDAGTVDDPPQPESPNVMHGFEVAQKTAERGAVLLKNAGNVLPLKAASVKSIAVIGGHADVGVMSGGGSSQVSPAGGNPVPPPPEIARNPLAFMLQVTYHRSAPLKGIAAKAPQAVVKFDAGTDPAAAAALAKQSQVAIVFATQHASEGMDLENLSLPNKQDALIEAVVAANPRTIVVLETGGAVLMPWLDKVAGVVEAWYPGIRGSEAIANVLFGDVNPSGKLPLTFPKSEADMPHPIHLAPPKVDAEHPMPKLVGAPGLIGMAMGVGPFFDVHYDEGLKVGYKWYDAENKTPLFPFGFGLSYTTFAYSDLKATAGDGMDVTFKLKNTGSRAGEETAQVYLSLPPDTGEPPRRLVGWSKVTLGPGEQKTVTVHVEPLMLSVFNVDRNAWERVPGEYKVSAGGSSRDLPVNATMKF
ncbi:beta-glucosidase [Occallatibacter riparius]|uniref:Glycoside hydrolase family 3 C-terminal domain-containing protein n=1 Tax=Occallatibacter riparius TaxID=1002689 RepID=A0A9J7BSQ0_9BACT|nr:glycoside hydrolase family 3 C-terminal domain-containing protein [Occallatibacter riparius]UWZ84778.1 glycoside hydrolase family 3 C-terminal domain-containing protein [Occallatibacter riparius]